MGASTTWVLQIDCSKGYFECVLWVDYVTWLDVTLCHALSSLPEVQLLRLLSVPTGTTGCYDPIISENPDI
eukprot:1344526-Amorphochlora_amoeboformis.AAC.1